MATSFTSSKDGTRRSLPYPAGTITYNEHMGGVDVGDICMKCWKLYKYVANFLLDTAITNAFVPYKMTHPAQNPLQTMESAN